MGKHRRTCGVVLSNYLCPNEVTGSILSDKSDGMFFSALVDLVDEYVEHHEAGSRKDWIDQHFLKGYPRDLSAGSMIHDLLTGLFDDLSLDVWECDDCGRLWIATEPGSREGREYLPEDSARRVKVLGLNSREDPAGE